MLKLRKGVASSLNRPKIAATLAVRHYKRCPMVIREGMQCGFTIISGIIPSVVKGKSSWRKVMPHVPFWPCLDANLSPIWGIRTERTLTLTILLYPQLTVAKTASTVPFSPRLARKETSRLLGASFKMLSPDPTCIFPTRISSLSTIIPGLIMPSPSSFLNLSAFR
jgi:hypothetical protein